MSTTDRWATFDCYGTLIDWNSGLRDALGSDELLARYHELEPQVQAEQPSRIIQALAGEGGIVPAIQHHGTAVFEKLTA